MQEKPVALVTGGSRGIGAMTARYLARDGFHVILTYNNAKSEAVTLAAEIDGQAIKTNLQSEDEITALFHFVQTEYGSLSLLVNNAGIAETENLETMNKVCFAKTIQTNLWASMLCAQKARSLIKDGSILFISSICARRPTPDALSYAVSKAGIEAFSRSIAAELAPDIRVNVIAPGATLTDMMQSNYSKEDMNWIKTHYPMRRACDPSDIAEIICFLASEKARNITGQILTVDSGSSLT